VESDTAGPVVSFSDVVRNHDGGNPVVRLSYSAHPAAHQVMTDVVAQLVKDEQAASVAAADILVSRLQAKFDPVLRPVPPKHAHHGPERSRHRHQPGQPRRWNPLPGPSDRTESRQPAAPWSLCMDADTRENAPDSAR